MQYLNIATTPSGKTAQTHTQTGNGAVQAAEPFASTLARQRTGAAAPDGDQPAPSSAACANAIVSGDETQGEAQTPMADASGILPSDMLAALLPASATANFIAANEKPDTRICSTDGASTLPGDMLAVLLPATVAATGADVTFGETWQSAGSQLEPLFRAQGNVKPVGEDAGSIAQSGVFPDALQASGKDVANITLSNSTARIAAQATQSDATALSGLAQAGAAPFTASPNGSVQTVIGTLLVQDARAHDAWSDEFSQKITWMATQHQQTAELHLNPPHLGPLDVVLSVSGDQATALFASPHAAVRDVVEQALPKLREMLADSGIMLGNATISDQAPRERQKGEGWPGKGSDATPIGGIKASTTGWHGRRQQGMVDTFA